MNEWAFIIDCMRFSFSRLNYTCLYEWFMHYIDDPLGETENSFYGQFGGFCHHILEQYANGYLNIFELAPYYEEYYCDWVTEPAPFNKYTDIAEDTYYKGLDYFQNIDLTFEKFDVLGVEKELNFKIGDYDFVGFIDLLLREKDTGKIIILDHKSSTLQRKKNGELSGSKQTKVTLEKFKKQLYLYSKPVIEEYGKVDELWWNMYKQRDWVKLPWKREEYEKSLKWAVNTIEFLKTVEEWDPQDKCGPNNNYCRTLCCKRDQCIYMNEGDEPGWL